MGKEIKVGLINGEFSVEEATDILMNMYSEKIQFHEMKNFSSKERLGREDQASTIRINELKDSIKKIQLLAKEAKENNANLIIESDLNIRFSSKAT